MAKTHDNLLIPGAQGVEVRHPLQNKENEHMNILMITHNDADAIGCALIARTLSNIDNLDIFYCQAGGSYASDKLYAELYSHPYDGVIVADIGINKSTVDEVEKYAKEYNETHNGERFRFIMIDHHQTNVWFSMDSDEYGTKHFFGQISGGLETDLSACELMFKGFSEMTDPAFRDFVGNTEISFTGNDFRLLDLCTEVIGAYDTWRWKKYPKQLTDNADMYAKVLSFYKFDDFVDVMYNNIRKKNKIFDDTQFALYNATEDAEAKAIKKGLNSYVTFNYNDFMSNISDEVTSLDMLSKVFEFHGHEYKIAIVFLGEYGNAVMEAIYNANASVDYVMGLYPDDRTISLRTNKPDVNVGRIAQRLFGGGGHNAAAGAKNIPMSRYLNLMEIYYYLQANK